MLLLDFAFKFMSSEQIAQVKAFQFTNNNSADFSGSMIELKTMCSDINHRVMQAVHDLESLRNKNTQLKRDSRVRSSCDSVVRTSTSCTGSLRTTGLPAPAVLLVYLSLIPPGISDSAITGYSSSGDYRFTYL
jgi:hypothetical protein